ncbi:MAG: Trm112 family protein [Hyphomicrobiaceae bacterium]
MTSPRAEGQPDIKLLELLVCPLTKTSLIYDKANSELVSRQARLAFPVRSGVPILVLAEARDLRPDEIPGGFTRS